jgi:hypothetical protein
MGVLPGCISWRCHPERIQHALLELLETLDETCEQAVLEINNADWGYSHSAVQPVTVASRPLRVGELAEFIAFDFNSGLIAKFQEGWDLEDQVNAVLSISTFSIPLALVNIND